MFNSRQGISAEEIERATILGRQFENSTKGRQFENSTKGRPQAQFDLIIHNLHKSITNYEEAVHRLWGLIETPKPTGEQGQNMLSPPSTVQGAVEQTTERIDNINISLCCLVERLHEQVGELKNTGIKGG